MNVLLGDVTFSRDEESISERDDEETENAGEVTVDNEPQETATQSVSGGGTSTQESMMLMMKTMMEGFTAPLTALVQTQASEVGKRKRTESEKEEEEEVKSTPILIHLENHTIKDDAHTVFCWESRSLRPFAGEQSVYWSNMKRVARPIIQDLKMGHFTKAAINPNMIAKLHDRGADMTGK